MTELSRSDSDSDTRSSLIQAARQHDPQAWEQLVELYGDLIFYWCRRAGLAAEDAADLLQEVFASVYRGLPKFEYVRPESTFRGWLWTITRNKLRDHFRRVTPDRAEGGTAAHAKLAEFAEPALGYDWDERSADPQDRSAMSRLYARAVEQVRGEFAVATFEAFWQTAVLGHKTRDVAESLGLSANTVRQHKSRVLRRLREHLGDLPPAEPDC